MIVTALAAMAIPAQASAGGNIIDGQRAIVWERGFDIMYWDSVNGRDKIAKGLQPAISSNGRFVTYISRGDNAGRVRVYDVRKQNQVPLPGLNVGDDFYGNPAVDADASRVVWDEPGGVGDPRAIFMYDVPTQQRITIGAPVNTTTNEDYPSLSNDGNLLAFVSPRTMGFDDVLLADISNPATPTLINLPNLNTNAAESDAYMSGDSQTFAYTTGPTFGRSVKVYDRTTSTVLTTPPLSSGLDIYNPALNSSGSIVAVARQVRDLGDTAVWLYKRGSGDFSKPGALHSDLTDSGPGIADPVSIKRRGN